MGEARRWTQLPDTQVYLHQIHSTSSSVLIKLMNDKTVLSDHFDPFDLFGALDFAMLAEVASDRIADCIKRVNELNEALAKYQKANGITPSAGYFGAKTRKAVME